MNKQMLLATTGCLFVLGLASQPVVDITLADNGNNQLEVRLRPNGPFNEVVSGVVFTLRWQETFGPALSVYEPVWPQSEFMPISSTPIVNPGNGYVYRTYTAVALSLMSDFGRAWEGGMEYPVCVMDILTPGLEVYLGNDDFTAANNRDYFVSLNGIERTGTVFSSPIPQVSAMAVNSGNGFIDVLLTPESDYFGWINSIDFTLRWPANGSSLGAIVQDAATSEAVLLEKVGPEETSNGFTYQRFHGEGASSLARAQHSWLGNEDHLLLRLPISGSIIDATVADDQWTAAQEGNYSIVLNGQPSAGGTDENSASTGPNFSEVIPSMQVVSDELHVTTAMGGSGTLVLSVLNAAGQPMMSMRAKWGTTYRINAAAWPTGMYILRAQTDAGMTARRFLK
ncbi:MAG: T9SS type A sorting domain-containing protein [Flavobacteriales bacterium]|nr:T9SS type A sorting domain-containing protein [Flavobacteriales bacterium]